MAYSTVVALLKAFKELESGTNAAKNFCYLQMNRDDINKTHSVSTDFTSLISLIWFFLLDNLSTSNPNMAKQSSNSTAPATSIANEETHTEQRAIEPAAIQPTEPIATNEPKDTSSQDVIMCRVRT